ncbi:Transcription factor JUNGBRUNNEN 1 [Platanthera zijinensis]|uniref:Transcription factor JUNGBRUNNEN 1 n=1 Tax=Platanthera zijinensis TaxID=2320716 RepID=A0AAP0BNB2_9ASPA
MEKKTGSELDLPGFRFHPTEDELLDFYLRREAAGKKQSIDIIGTLNLYLYDPWDLPSLAKMGEKEWYFFVPRDRRQSNGGRPNRTTERGFWKATGSDRSIRSVVDPRRLIGLKKTLVYYLGRAPRGTKTEWVMNEYRLPAVRNTSSPIQPPSDEIVLCKIYRKATSMKELEQRAAIEEDSRASSNGAVSATSSDQEDVQRCGHSEIVMEMNEEYATTAAVELRLPKMPLLESSATILRRPIPHAMPTAAAQQRPAQSPTCRKLPNLPAIEVPSQASFDWEQDSFLSQLRSPWIDQWSPLYANMLNF